MSRGESTFSHFSRTYFNFSLEFLDYLEKACTHTRTPSLTHRHTSVEWKTMSYSQKGVWPLRYTHTQVHGVFVLQLEASRPTMMEFEPQPPQMSLLSSYWVSLLSGCAAQWLKSSQRSYSWQAPHPPAVLPLHWL